MGGYEEIKMEIIKLKLKEELDFFCFIIIYSKYFFLIKAEVEGVLGQGHKNKTCSFVEKSANSHSPAKAKTKTNF